MKSLKDLGYLLVIGILLLSWVAAMTLLLLTSWGATGWNLVAHALGFVVLAGIALWLAR